jgi:uncharacterized protein
LTPHLVLALVLSTLIGLSLGLLGGGGSMLAVPLFVYVARVEVRSAIGLSLAVVGATALVGGLVHARAGRVDLRAAAVFGGAGMLGAPLGAEATHAVPPRVLMLLFAGLMLIVGTLMLRGGAAAATGPATSRSGALVAAGLGVGFLTGFLGVGGGFLIVPALTLLTGLPVHRAVGTSLLVIAASAAAGLAAHLRQGGLPLGLAAAFTAVAALGALAGVRLAAGLDPRRLSRAFAALVLVVGLFLLAKLVLGA